METGTLAVVALLRAKRPADLARMAGVSRAAVSLWMKRPVAEIRARHLRALAEGLGVEMETLMRPLPLLDDPEAVRRLEAALLWDRLYPSLAAFAVALARRARRAIARLVEVYGLFHAEQVVGRVAWDLPAYRSLLPPARRRECERLCGELARLRLI